MRLHKIHLKNFISHRDTIISFEELRTKYDTNFILISGDTGSGKSSILDGLLYGLYGLKSHGKNVKKRELRSDYAKPNEKWEVEVEFQLNNTRYKVIRSEKGANWYFYQDEKYQLLEEAPELPIQTGEIARKVMIIPQGEYLHLLNAKPSERRELILNLVNIQWIDKFISFMNQEKLKIKNSIDIKSESLRDKIEDIRRYLTSIQLPSNKLLSEEIETLLQQLNDKVNNWIENASFFTNSNQLDIKELIDNVKNRKIIHNIEKIEEVANKLISITEKYIENNREKKKLYEDHKNKIVTFQEKDLKEVKEQFIKFKDLANKKDKIESLKKQAKEIQNIEKHFKQLVEDLSRIYLDISDTKLYIEETEKELRLTQAKLVFFRKIDKLVSPLLNQIIKDLHSLKLQIENLLSILNTGKKYFEEWNSKNEMKPQLDFLIEQIPRLQSLFHLIETIKPHLNSIYKIQEKISLESEKQKQKKKELLSYQEQEQQEYNKLKDIQSQIGEQEKQKEQIENVIKAKKKKREEVEKEREALEANYRKIIIAELVSSLKPGEPCPICGSKEHPNPAPYEMYPENKLKEIIQKREKIRIQINELNEQIKQLENQLDLINNSIEKLYSYKEKQERDLSQIATRIAEINTELNNIEKQLQNFHHEKLEHLEHIKNKMINAKVQVKKTQDPYLAATQIINDFNKAWKSFIEKANKINQLHKTTFSLKDEDSIEILLNSLPDQIQNLRKEIEIAELQYKSWLNNTYSKAIKSFQSLLFKVASTISETQKTIQNSFTVNPPEDILILLEEILSILKQIQNNQILNLENIHNVSFEKADIIEKIQEKIDIYSNQLQEKIDSYSNSLSTWKEKAAQVTGKRETAQNRLQELFKQKQNKLNEFEEKKNQLDYSYTLQEIKEKLSLLPELKEWEKNITEWETSYKDLKQNLLTKITSLQNEFIKLFPNFPLTNPILAENTNQLDHLDPVLTQMETKMSEELNNIETQIKDLENHIKNAEKQMKDWHEYLITIHKEKEQLLNQIKTLKSEYQSQQQFERIYKLVGIQEGKNKIGLREWLANFILKHMLKNASPYLREFSDQRLDFVVEPGSSTKPSPIQIIDYSYHKIREVNDLSGGEKFMTALSLALGLTDLLLQFESNASRPNFLFIDEGFGTLDTERLRKVVAALKKYADQHDILLGVISHRQEMHELAPIRIHVTHDHYSKKGSQIQILFS